MRFLIIFLVFLGIYLIGEIGSWLLKRFFYYD
jgi:hypothetical protein